MIAQHQLLGVRVQIHLLVYPTLRWASPQSTGTGRHPLGHRIALQVMLQPVRGYVSGTMSGTNPVGSPRWDPGALNQPKASLVPTGEVVRQEVRQMLDRFLHGFAGL